jgi:hypothetical protein
MGRRTLLSTSGPLIHELAENSASRQARMQAVASLSNRTGCEPGSGLVTPESLEHPSKLILGNLLGC